MGRAQVAILDMIIASALFMAIIIPAVYFWNLTEARLTSGIEYEEMQLKAFQTSDLLIKSQGKPTRWESDPNSTIVLGLADSERTLSQDKVNTFLNISYNKTRALLNMGLYNFKIKLKDHRGDTLKEYGRNFTGINSVNLARYVIYGGEKGIFEITIWK